jgi:hypothetical protein
MSKKKVLVNYTDRDFNSIKKNLEEHARLYYPDSYKDFSENSFGSYVLDTVAYVGDMLSFYLDYQVNESFLETSLEYENIRRKASRYGYSFFGRPAAYGMVTLYVKVPANNSGIGPDMNKVPILKSGAEFTSDAGTRFILTEDVNFADPKNDMVASTFSNTSGKPTEYAIRAFGQVRSTSLYRITLEVDDFVKMRKVLVGPPSISAIHSVRDSEGHEYYEVKHLSQDTVYVGTTNPDAKIDGVTEIIKSKIVKRRFVLTQDSSGTYLQFGQGDDESVGEVDYFDPISATLKMSGRNYISDTSFDPNNLLNNGNLGIGPSNTTLTILFYQNEEDSINMAAGTINNVGFSSLEFPTTNPILATDVASIRNSLEVYNDKPIVGSTALPTTEEIRYRSYGSMAAQDRTVTRNDYEAFCYLMPPQYGSIKRASIINDPSSTNRRLSLYVISNDDQGYLIETNSTIKNNLKQWLNNSKMLNDNIDIYSPFVINIGIDFEIIIDPTMDKVAVLNQAKIVLTRETADKMYIGESFSVSTIFNILNKVDGVIDTTVVTPVIKTGTGYSPSPVSIFELKSQNGLYLKAPKNAIFEIKFPNRDIRGSAV